MGTEYSISIRRKSDNKELGKAICNQLKTIFDSEYSKLINCECRMSAHKRTFNYTDINNVVSATEKDVDLLYFQIIEKKLLSAAALNAEVKAEFDNEVTYLFEHLKEILDVHYAAAHIIGTMCTITENMFKNLKDFDDVKSDEIDSFNIPAFVYNAEDIKNNGNSSIWVEDVYCIIEAS